MGTRAAVLLLMGCGSCQAILYFDVGGAASDSADARSGDAGPAASDADPDVVGDDAKARDVRVLPSACGIDLAWTEQVVPPSTFSGAESVVGGGVQWSEALRWPVKDSLLASAHAVRISGVARCGDTPPARLTDLFSIRLRGQRVMYACNTHNTPPTWTIGHENYPDPQAPSGTDYLQWENSLGPANVPKRVALEICVATGRVRTDTGGQPFDTVRAIGDAGADPSAPEIFVGDLNSFVDGNQTQRTLADVKLELGFIDAG